MHFVRAAPTPPLCSLHSLLYNFVFESVPSVFDPCLALLDSGFDILNSYFHVASRSHSFFQTPTTAPYHTFCLCQINARKPPCPCLQSCDALSTNHLHRDRLPAMSFNPESRLDQLWKEYSIVFQDFDDLTLARWLAQTLGQLDGRVWRLSHPLMGAYRLAAQLAHQRQVWLKRLATPPAAYAEAPCCRAPMLPLLTRDVKDSGLVCQHCNETMVPFEEIPDALRAEVENWAAKYAPVHAVAHWDDRQRKGSGNYDHAYEEAAEEAERLLGVAGKDIAPKFLEFYPAAVWEDQDECLSIQPEDIELEPK